MLVLAAQRHQRKRKETDDHFLPLFEEKKKQYEAELLRIETEYAGQCDRLRKQRSSETRTIPSSTPTTP